MRDNLRIPAKRNLYNKVNTTNWNRKHFKINENNITSLITSISEDENTEQIEEIYKEQELSRSVFNFKSNQKVLERVNSFHQFG